MIALDATFLVDYLDGIPATKEFLAARDEQPVFAPSLALFEVYRGAARAGSDEGLQRAVSALEWLEPLPLTNGAATEAALIESELLAAGEPVNLGDVLVAGICRQHGARLVTRDEDFERVADLSVERY